ncbi:MAG TPA: hypothetical protein PK082_04175 [Phycisphaerae bacterium]|nr:hypothetical protein [Phycisphaerae bacterium]
MKCFKKICIGVGVLVAAAIISGVIYFIWIMQMLETRVYDETESISSYLGHEYVIEYPMFLIETDGKRLLWTGIDIQNFPKSVEEYEASPTGWPAKIVDALQPGTRFQIVSLYRRASPTSGERYVMFMKIQSGKYKGTVFETDAKDIMQRDEKGKWTFLSFVHLDSASGTSGGN